MEVIVLDGMLEALLRLLSEGGALFHALIEWLVRVVGAMGYPGIVMLMFLESSFFPFPSEVVMPPAGYLASQGKMSLLLVIASGVLGSILGALFNYYIAMRWGRRFFDRFGKYFLVSPATLDKADEFFAKHGHISTFTARLLPVIRQYVSLPAGLARMDLGKFCFFTVIGSGIWVSILTLIGYWVGYDARGMDDVIRRVSILLVSFCTLLVAGYVAYWRMKRRKAGA